MNYYAAIFVRGIDKSFSQCMPPVRSFPLPCCPHHPCYFVFPSCLLFSQFSLFTYCMSLGSALYVLAIISNHHRLVSFTAIIMSLSFLNPVRVCFPNCFSKPMSFSSGSSIRYYRRSNDTDDVPLSSLPWLVCHYFLQCQTHHDLYKS